MSLIFANEALENSDQFILIAKDSATGIGVIVGLSRDAVEDFGLESAKRTAEAKYSAGLLEPDGSVFVRASDLHSNRTQRPEAPCRPVQLHSRPQGAENVARNGLGRFQDAHWSMKNLCGVVDALHQGREKMAPGGPHDTRVSIRARGPANLHWRSLSCF